MDVPPDQVTLAPQLPQHALAIQVRPYQVAQANTTMMEGLGGHGDERGGCRVADQVAMRSKRR